MKKAVLKTIAIVSSMVCLTTAGAYNLYQNEYAAEVIASADEIVWDGTSDISWFDTSKTEFEISTPQQLAGLAVILNENFYNFEGKTIFLTSDIVLNAENSNSNVWTAIGGYYGGMITQFKGTFNGCGHKITGLYVSKTSDNAEDESCHYQGLFGSIGPTAVIMNLNIEGGSVTGNQYVGAIAGYAYKGGRIENCTSSAEVSAIYKTAGGIIGYGYQELIVTGCENIGTVNAPERSGGIAGGLYQSQITNCVNNGTVTGDSKVGGIVGYTYSESSVSDCTNNGKVCDIGGAIVGTNSGDCVISDCKYLEDSAVNGVALNFGTADISVFSGSVTTIVTTTPTETTTTVTTTPTETTTTVITTPTETTTTVITTPIETTTTVTTTSTEKYLNKTNLNMNVGDVYALAVFPESDDIVWGSTNTAIAVVKNGVVTAVGAGKVVISAITDGIVLNCTVVVTDPQVSIEVGDVNEDGKISSADFVMLKSAILEGDDSKKTYDINGDSRVSVLDIIELRRIILK